MTTNNATVHEIQDQTGTSLGWSINPPTFGEYIIQAFAFNAEAEAEHVYLSLVQEYEQNTGRRQENPCLNLLRIEGYHQCILTFMCRRNFYGMQPGPALSRFPHLTAQLAIEVFEGHAN